MLNNFLDFLSDMGFGGVIIGIFAFIIIPGIILLALGFGLSLILEMIPNKRIKILLAIVFYTLLLPCMLMFNLTIGLTDSEIKWGAWDLSVRNKSALIIFVTVVYIFLYYKLFTYIF